MPLQVLHRGKLDIGGIIFNCYILDNNKPIKLRVIAASAIYNFLEARRTPGARIVDLSIFNDINTLIINKLGSVQYEPIEFQIGNSQVMYGYEAGKLIDLCNAIIDGLNTEMLPRKYKKIAKKAIMLIQAVAKIGIIALIDEATGYQVTRGAKELQAILEAYISPELLAWQRKFPVTFYTEMFRLKGWEWNTETMRKKPWIVGKYTNELVYSRLPKGVLEELKRVTPKDDKGRYTARFHQSLTTEIGNPHLEKQLAVVVSLMKASDNWNQFESAFGKNFSNVDLSDVEEKKG